MADQNPSLIKTTQKSFEIMETIDREGPARLVDLVEILDMNKSTLYNHLHTLQKQGYVIKNGNKYAPAVDFLERESYLERQFELFEALKDHHTVGAIADELEINETIVQSYLRSLEQYGFVVETAPDEYRLGLKFLDYGGFTRKELDLYDFCKSKIDDLAEETGELANLIVEENGQGVYLYQSQGQNSLALNSYEGFHCHLHSTALGKALLAFMPEERVDEIIDQHGLPQLTPQTICDRETLHEELETVRERGYAIDDEERLSGLRCVAAPILDEDGRVLASISIAAPKSRMGGDRFETEIPELIQSTVNVTELNLNYG